VETNRKAILVLLLLAGLGALLISETPVQTVKKLHSIKVSISPKIDGSLDEEVWQEPPTVDDIFITYNPSDGEVLPQKTRVWVAHDEDNLYFAVHCHDTEPDRIKTSVTKRDNMFSDDWFGIALDALGSRQCLYEFFVNPSGIQGDLYNTPASGENSAPDWVWYSGGTLVEDGYTLEIHVPLKSIRFKHGENVGMNILFWRRINRLGMSGAWPQIDPGSGLYNSATEVKFDRLSRQLLLEFLPSVTYGNIWDRQTPDAWSEGDGQVEAGISGKVGITSASTAEFTVNPDFSQVESDTFQITRNRRYPIFYSEKRPFFMEAGDQFDLVGSVNNLWTAVHTRKIVDPVWGTRLTGDLQKFSFAGLVAADRWPGRALEEENNFYRDQKAHYMIGRGKYGLGGDNYLGFLYSGKELGDYHNRVLALDSILRFGKAHRLKANIITTTTQDPQTDESYGGNAYNAQYIYSTQSFFGSIGLEKYDRDFQMDTAFYQRTGIFYTDLWLVPTFTIKSDRLPWLKSIQPVFATSYTHDYHTGMNDRYLNIGANINTLLNGQFTVAWDIIRDESWEGTTYDTGGFWGGGSIQALKWLNLGFSYTFDTPIYYNEQDSFGGRRRLLEPALTFQPMKTLSLRLSYQYTDFDRRDSGEDVYDYHIFYSRGTYQPNRHLFFRALLQYDSDLDVIMGDLLASYELVPGTVLHVGYGSLHENIAWDAVNRRWFNDLQMREFYHKSQSFFVKCSYRLQF